MLESVGRHPEVSEVYLHMWTANEDALRLYRRFGFTVSETVAGYYHGISPADCHILRKAVNVVAGAAAGAEAPGGAAAAPATQSGDAA